MPPAGYLPYARNVRIGHNYSINRKTGYGAVNQPCASKNDSPESPPKKRLNPAGKTVSTKAEAQQLLEASGQLFYFFK